MSGTIRIEKFSSSAAGDDVTVPRDREPGQAPEAALLPELSSSALAEDVTTSGQIPEDDAASLVGTMISGRYRIGALIGKGGMGAVYRGEQVHLRKQVAIKILRPGARRIPQLAARFEREAVAGAHIQHPNIAPAIDFGQLENESYFLVLEYVDGTPLKQTIAAGALPAGRALRIARQIAAALEAVHAKNIVHRDIKPQNVLLDGHDHVKLIDFGLAKVPLEMLSSSTQPHKAPVLTAHGELFGTLGYLAPETATGMDAVDARADLYALGIVLYEMLAGRHPFDGSDGFSVFKHQRLEDPPPIRMRAPEVQLPPEVESVVMRLIQRDPAQRYSTAAQAIAAIDEAIALVERSPARAPQPGAAMAAGPDKPPASFVPIGPQSAAPGRWWLPAAGAVLIVLGGALPFILRESASPEAGKPATTADGAQSPPAASAAQVRPSQAAENAPSKIDDADATVWRLRLKQSRASKNWTQGAKAILALAQIDPRMLTSGALRADVLSAAVGIAFAENQTADEVFDLFTNNLGTDGLDILFDMMRSQGGSKGGKRAAAILARPEVLERASPGLRMTYDFRKASCDVKRTLFDRAVEEGDRRTLGELQILHGAQCRNKKDPCCFREDQAIVDAIRRLQNRLGN